MRYFTSCILVLIFSSVTIADDKSCFPTGMARHDQECYDFEKDECLKTDDIYSCGWGKRKENPPPDDEMLVCDNSRCPNYLDEPVDED